MRESEDRLVGPPSVPVHERGGKQPLWLGAEELRAALAPSRAVELLEAQVRSSEPPQVPRRTSMSVSAGATLMMMPAALSDAAGVKLVTTRQNNGQSGLPFIHGVYILFETASMAPVAVIDGAELTRIRTPAVSALATRYLARANASRLVMFGAGVQAVAHIESMRAVRPIAHITVIGAGEGRARQLVDKLREQDIDAQTGTPEAVARADIVCTCTTSGSPVFDGRDLAVGVHINAIGAYQPEAREVDDTTVRRARIVVEDRDAVLAEAGDLIIPIQTGVLRADQLEADLYDAVNGLTRRSDADITLFKSVGVAWEDLVLARAAYRQAR